MLNAVVENKLSLPRAGRFLAWAKVGFWEVVAISISTGACVTIIATGVAAEAADTDGVHFKPWDEHLCWKAILLKSRRVNLRLLGASSVTRIEWIQLACTAEKVEVMGEHVRARRSKYQCTVHELIGGRGPGGQTFVLLTRSTTRLSRDLHTSATNYDCRNVMPRTILFAEFIRSFGFVRLWILQEICASCRWIFAC